MLGINQLIGSEGDERQGQGMLICKCMIWCTVSLILSGRMLGFLLTSLPISLVCLSFLWTALIERNHL